MHHHVMVCIANIRNAEKLLQRGSVIAKAYGGACHCICVESETYDPFIYEHMAVKRELQAAAERHQAAFHFLGRSGRTLASTIADFAKNNDIGHIILGQIPKNRLALFTQGSLTDEIFTLLDDVDLHIVEVSPEPYSRDEEYERGLKAYWLDNELVLESSPSEGIQGIFFKRRNTDFNSGVFVWEDESGYHFVDIH